MDSFCSIESEEEARNNIKETLRANIEEVDRRLGLIRDEREQMNRRQAEVERGEPDGVAEYEGSDCEAEKLSAIKEEEEEGEDSQFTLEDMNSNESDVGKSIGEKASGRRRRTEERGKDCTSYYP